ILEHIEFVVEFFSKKITISTAAISEETNRRPQHGGIGGLRRPREIYCQRRVFLILLYFGWAFLPMLYLAAFIFDVPATGFTRMTLFSIFTGVAAFLVIQVLSTEGLDLEYVGNALHWVFLALPHYSLANGIMESYKMYAFDQICSNCPNDSGKCLVLTSHSMEECEALCTRQAIMVNGNFKCLGSTQHLKDKFAEGYTLVIKVKKVHEDSTDVDVERIERFIQQHFPGAKLREKHQELINYYITDKSVPWSKMFGVLEEGKRGDLNIEDYSLGQSSLEQVFLTFTRHQTET
ncbi:hypothetical protein NQ317_001546, partial [Molorchus minor]